MAKERIQKIIAQAGIASRRKAEELIQEGEVSVNGKIAKLGDQADSQKDAIKVRGKLLRMTEKKVYFCLFKPKGVISAFTDTHDRPHLGSYFQKVTERIYPVGKLDFNSEGLLLVTNDGSYAGNLQSSSELVQIFHAKVKGHPDEKLLKRLTKGAFVETSPMLRNESQEEARPEIRREILEEKTQEKKRRRFVQVHEASVFDRLAQKSILKLVVLGSGATELKALLSLCGFKVEKVVRHAIGQIEITGMKPGEVKKLTEIEANRAFMPISGIQKPDPESEKVRRKRPKIPGFYSTKKSRSQGPGSPSKPGPRKKTSRRGPNSGGGSSRPKPKKRSQGR